MITEHDTWTDYGVRALPNRLLVVNLDPSAAARCPTPADAIDTGQADLLMAGVVTPALAGVWLARADNADLSAVVVSSGPEECVAGVGVLRFVVAIDENTAAGVFSIPVSNVDTLRHAVAVAAQAAGHPFRDEDTPVVALDPAGAAGVRWSGTRGDHRARGVRHRCQRDVMTASTRRRHNPTGPL